MCVPSTHPIICGNPNFSTKLPAAFSKSALFDSKTIYFFLKMFIMALTTTYQALVNSVHPPPSTHSADGG